MIEKGPIYYPVKFIEKDGFLNGLYTIVSISHQASKQALKQTRKEHIGALKIVVLIILSYIVLDEILHLQKSVLTLVRNPSSSGLVYKFADVFKVLLGTLVLV